MLQRLIDHKKADTQTVEPSRITVEFRGQTTIVLRWDNVSPEYEMNLQSGADEMTVNEKSDLETGGGEGGGGGRRRRKWEVPKCKVVNDAYRGEVQMKMWLNST